MVALATIVAACQPAPTGNPATGSPEPHTLPSPNPPASPLPSPGASGSPAGTPGPVSSVAVGWSRAALPAGLDAPLTRVVWTGSRFLAVQRVDGTVLDSLDGRTWHQQPAIPDGFVEQVAAGPGGVLAIGSVNAQGVVAIWHSADGLRWERTPDAPSLHSRDGAFLTMATVVAAGGGWLAVGGETLNCIPGACRLVRAVVWSSPDGLRWTRQPDTATIQHAEMTGVTSSPSGYVAVGDAAADPTRLGSPIQPAVWTSSDGQTWTRSDRLPTVAAPGDADVVLGSVAVAGSRVVAVGYVRTHGGPDEAFAWWSDGGPWASVEIGPFVGSQGVRIVAVPGGWLAMFGPGADPPCSSALWSSVDGSAWSCLGNDPAFAGSTVSDAAAAPTVEVLVGADPDGAVVWTAPLH